MKHREVGSMWGEIRQAEAKAKCVPAEDPMVGLMLKSKPELYSHLKGEKNPVDGHQ